MGTKYEIHVTKAVEKDLDDLEPYRARVVSELLALEADPRKGHALHGKLTGYLALEFSLLDGACRAIYKVKKAVANNNNTFVVVGDSSTILQSGVVK